MATNIEIKVQVDSLTAIRQQTTVLSDKGPFALMQVDYFFPVVTGRLKLRIEQSDVPGQEQSAELISYERIDEARARASNYSRCRIPDPYCLRKALYHSLGKGPVVRKKRELYLIGRTRIHLDTVDGLGTFVEIEVVMEPGEPPEHGVLELHELLLKLGLQNARTIDVAYADLLGSLSS